MSFRPGEEPQAETLRAVEARLCEGWGFGEHQRVSALHYDTDNLHLHIAINKIHPTRYTIKNPYNDYKTLAKLCETLERDYTGWSPIITGRKGAGQKTALRIWNGTPVSRA